MPSVFVEIDERRSSLRLDMEQEIVNLAWVDSNGKEQSKRLVCIDVSSGGFQIENDQPMDISTEVTVTFKPDMPDTKAYPAKVLRCNQQDNLWYLIGFSFIK